MPFPCFRRSAPNCRSASPRSSSSRTAGVLRGIDANVVVLMLLELFERLAFYATTFTLTTYCVRLLGLSVPLMNVVVNLLYTVSPLSAVIGGGISDGSTGRKWVLLCGAVVYTIGLSMVALSAMPLMFTVFPTQSSTASVALVMAGTMVFGCGYGVMKVCLAPLLADCALASFGPYCVSFVQQFPQENRRIREEEQQHQRHKQEEGKGKEGKETERHAKLNVDVSNDATRHCVVGTVIESINDPTPPASCLVHHSGGGRHGSSGVVLQADDTNDNNGGESTAPPTHNTPTTTATTTTTAPVSALPGAENTTTRRGRREWSGRALDSGEGLGDNGATAATTVSDTTNDTKDLDDKKNTKTSDDEKAHLLIKKQRRVVVVVAADVDNDNKTAAGGGGDRKKNDNHEKCDDGEEYEDGDGEEDGSHSRHLQDGDDVAQQLAALISRLFRVDYFIINFGSMIGIAGAPFLRDADPTTITAVTDDGSGSGSAAASATTTHVGYYYAFWAAAASTAIGTVIFALRIPYFPRNHPARTLLLFRVVFGAIRGWLRFRFGRSVSPFSSSSASPQTTEKEESALLSKEIRSRFRTAVLLAPPHHAPHGASMTTSSSPSAPVGDDALNPKKEKDDETGTTIVCLAEGRDLGCDDDELDDGEEHYDGPRFVLYNLFPAFEEAFFARRHRMQLEEQERNKRRRKTRNNNTNISRKKHKSDDETQKTLFPKHKKTAGQKNIQQGEVQCGEEDEDEEDENDDSALVPNSLRCETHDLGTTLSVCANFVALPIYWLLSSQFSTNIVLQAGWMAMPGSASLPPELFNNVNTLTILVFIPLLDAVVQRRIGLKRRLSVVGRLTCGFGLMLLAMAFCATLQYIIASRGTFDDQGNYSLRRGESLLSAAWLLIPYVIQGVAAVLVDTTSIEAAYTAAPVSMKSTVMALYLLASSGSGFLGLAFAPFMTATHMTMIMFTFCGLQAAVIVLFLFVAFRAASWRSWPFCWRRSKTDTTSAGTGTTTGSAAEVNHRSGGGGAADVHNGATDGESAALLQTSQQHSRRFGAAVRAARPKLERIRLQLPKKQTS